MKNRKREREKERERKGGRGRQRDREAERQRGREFYLVLCFFMFNFPIYFSIVVCLLFRCYYSTGSKLITRALHYFGDLLSIVFVTLAPQ